MLVKEMRKEYDVSNGNFTQIRAYLAALLLHAHGEAHGYAWLGWPCVSFFALSSSWSNYYVYISRIRWLACLINLSNKD